jgi:hypothetical protein
MITILYPELQPLVEEYPAGLRILNIKVEKLPWLIVKAPKEFLLAARTNNGFKIYVVPLQIGGTETISLVSAFFDIPDEPLCIFTPCFEDAETKSLIHALDRGEVQVHLVDEHGRQLLGYPAKISIPPVIRDRIKHRKLLQFSNPAARNMCDSMNKWFGLRDTADDAEAISVDFGTPLFPEDIAIMNLIPEMHSYHGGKGYEISMLDRKEPGSFQERDIVQLLQRIFLPEQIFLGPLRVTDEEEICDVLVITDDRVLVIQAKDSPNTEAIMRKKMVKKRSTIMRHLTKAIRQVSGAIGYIRSTSPLQMLVLGEEVFIDLAGRELVSLIVVRELFADQYSDYSPPILDLIESTEVACIPLDYMELHMYTKFLDDENAFFAAFYHVFENAIARGEFPRLRFGMAGE